MQKYSLIGKTLEAAKELAKLWGSKIVVARENGSDYAVSRVDDGDIVVAIDGGEIVEVF